MKNIPGKVILQGVGGSHAYGMAREGSDIDTKGIYVTPMVELTSLNTPKETVVQTNPDFEFHEVGKLVRLALKCNPTVTELLWLDEYDVLAEEAEMLIDIRSYFLSKPRVAGAYGGYAMDQMKRMLRAHERMQTVSRDETPLDLRKEFSVGRQDWQGARPVVSNVQSGSGDLQGRSGPAVSSEFVPGTMRYKKAARHCFRLMLQGKQLLLTGMLTVKVADPEKLFEIGELEPEDLVERFKKEYADFQKAEEMSSLRVVSLNQRRGPVDRVLREIRKLNP